MGDDLACHDQGFFYKLRDEGWTTTMAVTTTRQCRVSMVTSDGVTHAVTVHGTSVFEITVAAVAHVREDGWAGALPVDLAVTSHSAGQLILSEWSIL